MPTKIKHAKGHYCSRCVNFGHDLAECPNSESRQYSQAELDEKVRQARLAGWYEAMKEAEVRWKSFGAYYFNEWFTNITPRVR